VYRLVLLESGYIKFVSLGSVYTLDFLYDTIYDLLFLFLFGA
jgi:hypothetical protein